MTTAVLVIDMQNGFLHEEGSFPRHGVDVPDVANVIAENSSLLARAREWELPVIYTRHVFRPGFVGVPARLLARLPTDPRPLLPGSWDADIHRDLAPAQNDTIIDKSRYDAFLYTDLELVLRGLRVRKVMVTGVVTSICVESTVRSGYQRDFEMMVASDCTSGPEPFRQSSLDIMASSFADVGEWRVLLKSLPALESARETDG